VIWLNPSFINSSLQKNTKKLSEKRLLRSRRRKLINKCCGRAIVATYLILINLKKSACFEHATKFPVHNFSIARGCEREKEHQTFFNRRTGWWHTIFSSRLCCWGGKNKSAAETGNSRDKKKLSQAAGYTLSSGAHFLPKRGALMLQKYFNKTHRVLHSAKKSVSPACE
jgi:hypothetical protein